jgi:hypothetical protein
VSANELLNIRHDSISLDIKASQPQVLSWQVSKHQFYMHGNKGYLSLFLSYRTVQEINKYVVLIYVKAIAHNYFECLKH